MKPKADAPEKGVLVEGFVTVPFVQFLPQRVYGHLTGEVATKIATRSLMLQYGKRAQVMSLTATWVVGEKETRRVPPNVVQT